MWKCIISVAVENTNTGNHWILETMETEAVLQALPQSADTGEEKEKEKKEKEGKMYSNIPSGPIKTAAWRS